MYRKRSLIALSLAVLSLRAMDVVKNELTREDTALLHATSEIARVKDDVENYVAHLIRKGASVFARDDSGWTALHSSALVGKIKVVRTLLDNGSPVDMRTAEFLKATALSIATMNGHIDVARLLLERGANPNAEDAAKCRVFHTAIVHRQLTILKLLRFYGADFSHTCINMPTIQLATERGKKGEVSLEILRYLLEQEAPFPGGYEALATLIEKKEPEIAVMLRAFKPRPHCGYCDKALEKLQVCGSCKKARYCGVTCQKMHWAIHKTVCLRAPAAGPIEDCCICLDSLTQNVVRIGYGCEHNAHQACKKLLLASKFNTQCPLCRAKIGKAA